MPGTSAKIFIAQSQLLPLDPVVVSNSPAHDATNVPINASIVLQFSKPMDTNSVQSAFSTTPAVGGTFAWSAAHDTMTFTPGGAGLPPLTTVVVRITNSAVDAVSGNAMFAPYQLQFHTGSGVADVTPPTISLLTPTNGALVSGNLLDFRNGGRQRCGAESRNRIGQRNLGDRHRDDFVEFESEQFEFSQWPARDFRPGDGYQRQYFAHEHRQRPIFQRARQLRPAHQRRQSRQRHRLQRQPLVDGHRLHVSARSAIPAAPAGYLNNVISGVCSSAQSLYQREHYSTSSGGFYYEFDCPEGVYETTLLEAETYWSGPGKRVFNVFIQGRQVLTNFDIYAAAGGMNIPISLVFTNAVTNSQLQILFTPGAVDNARVSGVQVRKIADVFSDTDGIPDWWRLAYFGHPLGSASDLSRGSDDADGDGVSNLTEYRNGTDPLNPASFPILPPFNLGPIAVQGGNVQLSFSSSSNGLTNSSAATVSPLPHGSTSARLCPAPAGSCC